MFEEMTTYTCELWAKSLVCEDDEWERAEFGDGEPILAEVDVAAGRVRFSFKDKVRLHDEELYEFRRIKA